MFSLPETSRRLRKELTSLCHHKIKENPQAFDQQAISRDLQLFFSREMNMSDSEESESGSRHSSYSSSEMMMDDGALDLSLPIRKRANESSSSSTEDDGPEDLSASGAQHSSKNPKKSLIRRYCECCHLPLFQFLSA